jgi:hypothetical protein
VSGDARTPRRQSLAIRPALAALEDRRLPRTLPDLFRERGTKSTVLTAAVNL